MRNVFCLAMLLIGLSLNAMAIAPIDDKVNNAQNFVVIDTPLYNGGFFLAFGAGEESNLRMRTLINIAQQRADAVCNLMGLGDAASFSATYNPTSLENRNKTYTLMYETLDGRLMAFDYPDVNWKGDFLMGRSAHISRLICTKK